MLKVCIYEFNQEIYEKGIREEGIQEAVERLNQLNQKLLALDRLDDLKRATQDLEYQKCLLEEFGL